MSKNTLELCKIGSRVKLTEDIYATIVSINIAAGNSITYHCGWWNGRSYSTENFSPNDIEVVTEEKFKIGFA